MDDNTDRPKTRSVTNTSISTSTANVSGSGKSSGKNNKGKGRAVKKTSKRKPEDVPLQGNKEQYENLAKFIKMGCTQKADVSKYLYEIKISENCKNLMPPLTNPEIWNNLYVNVQQRVKTIQEAQKNLCANVKTGGNV